MTESKSYYQNECPFEGSRELVPFEHMLSRKMIPLKCSTCKYQEEGRCLLLTNPLKKLDYDYCGIAGETHLVDVKGISYPLPAKCVHCEYFFRHPKTSKLIWCNKDKPEDCDIGRGLDYGDRDLAQLEDKDDLGV